MPFHCSSRLAHFSSSRRLSADSRTKLFQAVRERPLHASARFLANRRWRDHNLAGDTAGAIA